MASNNKSALQVARELEVAGNILRRWCKEQGKLASLPPTEESKDEELRRLRTKVANLKEDNTILKKATAHFCSAFGEPYKKWLFPKSSG